MNPYPMQGGPAGVPVIPPPPPRAGRPGGRGTGRFLLWSGALALGVALGVVAYRFIPGVDFYFDYWIALALG